MWIIFIINISFFLSIDFDECLPKNWTYGGWNQKKKKVNFDSCLKLFRFRLDQSNISDLLSRLFSFSKLREILIRFDPDPDHQHWWWWGYRWNYFCEKKVGEKKISEKVFENLKCSKFNQIKMIWFWLKSEQTKRNNDIDIEREMKRN